MPPLSNVFIPNPFWPDLFERSEDGASILEGAAERGKTLAESTAPVGFTGDYKRSFEVQISDEGEVILTNTDFKAHWLEFGTQHMPPQAVIRNAIASAGYPLDSGLR